MNGMLMPVGSTMSTVVSTLMMAAMMLPSSALLLQRDRLSAVRRRETRLIRNTAIVGAGYFLVWIVIGAAAAPLGNALAPLGPIAAGVILLVAGAMQFTSWKARALECLERQSTGAGKPFRRGLRLGLHCARCCGNLMAALFVVGAMDRAAMAVVTVAITLERVSPAGEHVAHGIGFVIVVVGVWLTAKAAGIV